AQLEAEALPIAFEYQGLNYAGDAMPVAPTCVDGNCEEWDVTLNDAHLGTIRKMKSGWKMLEVADKKLVKQIGSAILLHYEEALRELTIYN
ncbi:MAG TPA: hypothetical protein VEB42_10720, partial [Chitinophagaceae bacterium]|nr:hypothetical protein [Chitinophagaceae bacterium]